MVPNGWKKGLLDEGIELISGQHVEANCVNNLGVGIPYLTGPADFPNGKIVVTKFTNEGKKFSKKGDLLITVKGSGTGKVIESDNEYAISRQLMAIRPKTFDSKFVYYNLVSSLGRYEDAATGLIPGISREDVLHTPLLIPPIDEQMAIAQILSTWDQAISTTEKMLENSQQQKKALMQQLLTSKKRFLDENGMIFSSKWLSEKLEKICAISTGKKDVNEGNPNGIYPFFTCASEPTASDSYSYDCEALLIAGNGNLGKTHYIKGKFEAYQRTYILSKFDEKIQPLYLYQYILYWLMRDIEREKQHGAMPYIKLGLLQNFKIFIPSLTEQLKIIEVLSLADQEIETLQKRLDCLKQEKKALMQQLLTGKKRVKVAA